MHSMFRIRARQFCHHNNKSKWSLNFDPAVYPVAAILAFSILSPLGAAYYVASITPDNGKCICPKEMDKLYEDYTKDF